MNKMKFLIFSFLLSSFSFSSSFGKIALTDFKSYAKTYQEYPRIDNKDFLNPDFTTFYKKMMPGFFSKAWNNTLSFLHLKEKPFWSVDKFKALLLQLVEKREKGNFIYKFSPKEGSKFIIWGDLQGAFHSLTRCLEELKKQGVIDEDLKIIKPAHYLVFNGDLVNRSAYSLETLFVVMTLMQQNPDKVFYMRGNNEDKEMWHSYGLKRELDIKAQSLSGEDKDLLTLSIDKFFNTLPLALFLRVNGNDEFVCISHRGLEEGKVEQAYFAKFLKDHFNGEVEKLNLDNATITSDFVNIEAIVKGISRSSIYLPTEGLSLYLPDHGATAWTILSSPTTVYQKMYNFYFDSFAEIEVCKNIYEWKISSFNQDARKKDGFKTHSYYLVSSQPTDLPQSKGKITVGCAKDFSTSSVVEAITLIHGLFAKLSKLNEEGGVGGKYIKLVILNDGYDPAMGIKAAEDFINLYKTDITLASFGSPTLKACLPMLKEGKLLVMFPWTGAPIFFDPNLPNVFHDKASYLDEGRILTDYAIKKLKAKKIAIFYQDDEGKDEELLRYFGDAKVFTNEDDAWILARQMEKDILSDDFCPILEYGVSSIHINKPFPNKE